MIRIFHLYGNKVNLGDWGSALGIRQLLESVTTEKIEYMDWHISYESNKIEENLVSKINKEYDAVIIGGGGLFKKRPKYSKENWPLGIMINISRRNIERIKVPIFIFSLGLNQDLGEKRRLFQKNYNGIYFDKKQIDNIRFLMDVSTLFSVRDVDTRCFLEEISGSKTIHLTPCPSMFLCQNKMNETTNKHVNPSVGISLRGNTPISLRNKIILIAPRLQNRGFDIIHISHNTGKGEVAKDLEKALGIKKIISDTPMQLMDNYRKLDFTIGMRCHSNIFSFGANKPFISLSYNIKNNSFAKMVEMKDYLLPTNKEWSVDAFMGVYLEMVKSAIKIKNKFKLLKDKFYGMNREFAQKIIQSI